MSEILKRIKEDLRHAMLQEVYLRKTGNNDESILKEQSQKEVSRAIISMFPEIDVKPDKATDDDVIKLLKKYISMEKTRELYIQKHLTEKDVTGLNATQVNTLIIKKFHELGDNLTSTKIEIAKTYLPKALSEEELKQWIKENIDLTQYKNKMQAMKPIMEQFKGMDGNIVKKALMSL